MKKKLFKIFKIVGIVLFVALLGGFIYLNMSTYDPMESANDLLDSDQVEVYGDYFVVEPDGEVVANLVYYQGGLVRAASYLPFAFSLAEEGVRVHIPKMPLNLAILNQDAFLDYEELFDDDLPVLIAGHSLGGASASLFLSGDEVLIDGLILLASYPANSADLSDAKYPVLSITASNDGVLDLEQYNESKSLLPSDTVYALITGGNHAYFGHYGEQNGDGEATISREEQQAETVLLILEMLDSLE